MAPLFAAALLTLVAACAPASQPKLTTASAASAASAVSPALQQLQADAKTVAPWARSAPAREFLAAAPWLPPQAPRTVYTNRTLRKSLTPAQHAQLSPDARAGY